MKDMVIVSVPHVKTNWGCLEFRINTDNLNTLYLTIDLTQHHLHAPVLYVGYMSSPCANMVLQVNAQGRISIRQLNCSCRKGVTCSIVLLNNVALTCEASLNPPKDQIYIVYLAEDNRTAGVIDLSLIPHPSKKGTYMLNFGADDNEIEVRWLEEKPAAGLAIAAAEQQESNWGWLLRKLRGALQ